MTNPSRQIAEYQEEYIMAQKLTKDEIDKRAEFLAQEILDEDSEVAEQVAITVWENIKTKIIMQVAMQMICEFGAEQAEKIAKAMVEKVRARTK